MRTPLRIFACLALLLFLCSCRAGVIDPAKAIPIDTAAPTEYLFDDCLKTLAGVDQPRLRVGAAAVDVSPYNYRVWIAGFGAGRISRGVLDPIFARALFIDDGRSPVVFLVLDVVGIGLPDVKRIRNLVTASAPERIIVIATHNHQGPDTLGMWGFGPFVPLESGILREYHEQMLRKAARAVELAVADAREASLSFGSVEIPEGWAENLWFPHDRSKLDSEMTVLRATDGQGRVIATLINWACHAEALFSRNHKISADFPGRFYREMEKRAGGTALFVSNAAGGMIVPYPSLFEERRNFPLDKRVEFIDRMGAMLAQKTEEALEDARSYGPGEIRIDLVRSQVRVPVENSMYRAFAENGVFDISDRDLIGDEALVTEVYAVDLGPAVIATIPGEPFPAVGLAIKQAMDAPHRFLFTLANDELGYMMLPDQFEDRAYRYERSASMGPQTGLLIQEAVLDLLKRLEEDHQEKAPTR